MSFPKQKAATRNFQLGAPRSFHITGDGLFVTFLRSDHGRDSVNSLWIYDVADNCERKIVDSRNLLVDSEDLPEAEKARRERMRETTNGITSYSCSTSGLIVTFALAGKLFVTEINSGETRHLDVPGPIIDPTISPDGTRVAWSTSTEVYTVDLTTGASTRLTPENDQKSKDITWGLADFIAAEEFNRSHGFWWLGNSSGLIIERTDNSRVQQWWLSDPTNPDKAPQLHRYPAAGTSNATVSLFLSDLKGQLQELTWPAEKYEYLLNVRCTSSSNPIVSVSDRAQREFVHYELQGSQLCVLTQLTDDCFLEVISGQPVIHSNRLVEVVDNYETDTRQIYVDSQPVSPEGLQVDSIIAVHDNLIEFVGAQNSTDREVFRISFDAELEQLTLGGVSNATGTVFSPNGAWQVIVQSRLDNHSRTFELRRDNETFHFFENLAETPELKPSVFQLESGSHGVKTAVLFPTNHQMGSRKLPILMRPYGGPHGAQVLDGALTYVEDQWYADQGFVVVVADGRGTPGRGPRWDRSIYQDFVAPVIADQVAAIQAVAQHFPLDVDATQVGIMGWSFGGYLSALAVMQRPDVFHAAVAGAPVTDWLLYDTAYTERYLGHPDVAPNVYQQQSLLVHAEKLSRPLMLIHGLADDNVVSAHTLKLSGELLAHGKPHSVLPLSGVTHMTPQEVVAENLMHLSVQFIKDNLNKVSG